MRTRLHSIFHIILYGITVTSFPIFLILVFLQPLVSHFWMKRQQIRRYPPKKMCFKHIRESGRGVEMLKERNWSNWRCFCTGHFEYHLFHSAAAELEVSIHQSQVVSQDNKNLEDIWLHHYNWRVSVPLSVLLEICVLETFLLPLCEYFVGIKGLHVSQFWKALRGKIPTTILNPLSDSRFCRDL